MNINFLMSSSMPISSFLWCRIWKIFFKKLNLFFFFFSQTCQTLEYTQIFSILKKETPNWKYLPTESFLFLYFNQERNHLVSSWVNVLGTPYEKVLSTSWKWRLASVLLRRCSRKIGSIGRCQTPPSNFWGGGSC